MNTERQDLTIDRQLLYPKSWTPYQRKVWDCCYQEKRYEDITQLKDRLSTDPTQFIIRWLPNRIVILKPSDNCRDPIKTFSLINQRTSKSKLNSDINTKIKDSRLSTAYQASLLFFNDEAGSWEFEKTVDYITTHPVAYELTHDLQSCYDILYSSLPILDEEDLSVLQTEVELKILDLVMSKNESDTQWYEYNELRTQYQHEVSINLLNTIFPKGLQNYDLQDVEKYVPPTLRENYQAKLTEKVSQTLMILSKGVTIRRAYNNCICTIRKQGSIYIFEWGLFPNTRSNRFQTHYKLRKIQLLILESVPIIDTMFTSRGELEETMVKLTRKNAEISTVEKVIRMLKYIDLGKKISFAVEDGRKVYVELSPINKVIEFPYLIEILTIDKTEQTKALHNHNCTRKEAILKLARLINQCPDYHKSFPFFNNN